jgi:hypothetical protein
MENKKIRAKRRNWEYSELLVEASKYDNRWAFQKNSNSAYQFAARRGWLDKICSHMSALCHNPYTVEELEKIALKYNTKEEFRNNDSGAYQAAHKMGILDKICMHMVSVYKYWSNEDLQIEALKYSTRNEFKEKNLGAYCTAHDRGIIEEICKHMGVAKNEAWTDVELQETALKYSNRSDFAKKDPGAYQAALRRGILNEICIHMGEYQNAPYTLEEMALEALKYSTRKKFALNSPSLYMAAWRANALDQVCAHMKRSGGTSLPELELLAIVKEKFSSAKKLRDRNVKIEGKPYIHRFELDISIAELNKGIEFDGKRYHSPEWLAKTKGKWPLEDALNKHAIKDAHFLSKGIQVLHIKEQDWIDNKEECIKRCFEFLGGK